MIAFFLIALIIGSLAVGGVEMLYEGYQYLRTPHARFRQQTRAIARMTRGPFDYEEGR